MKLVRGRYVIDDPALPAGGIIEDGAVAIEDGKVVAVDRHDLLARRYPEAEALGSADDVVLPGLVNSHSHGWGLTPLQMGVDGRLPGGLQHQPPGRHPAGCLRGDAVLVREAASGRA